MTNVNELNISNALEDYLKAIYTLSRKKPTVRITDIALYLNISKPSVNRAVNTLKRQGLVFHEPYGDIMLTPEGEQLGCIFFARYDMVKKFLINVLNIPDDNAAKEAHKIGKNISQETIDRMIQYMEN